MQPSNISKKEYLDAVTLGVKQAILTMCEAGDGYDGEIIRDQFLKSVETGIKSAIDCDTIWHLTEKIEYLAEMTHELGVEIYKYRFKD